MASPDESSRLASQVAGIIQSVREGGDEALRAFARRWDGVELGDLCVPAAEMAAARDRVSDGFIHAFRLACERIRRFHEEARPRSWFTDGPDGEILGIRWTPIARVGLYVPGGKASYPSTLAMTVVPARVAGVEEIIVTSPSPGPEILAAAAELGLGRVYRVGGAQAIAAMAIGTETIPRVDKIFGPGNRYVTEAKRQLFGEVGIDLLAGPSEIVVYADDTASPEVVAADLAAQAEHDETTRATLLGTSPDVVRAVREALDRLVDREPRRDVIRASIEANGRFEVVAGPGEAAGVIDAIAPEHLSIQARDPWSVLALVRNAGAIYLGGSSAAAAGDYLAGPNHVLPTGGAARFASSLCVEDFMKRSNVAFIPGRFLDARGEEVITLAETEGLSAHATSIRVRTPRSRR